MRPDWKGALGILLGAGLLWYALRNESFSAIWGVLRDSNWLLLVLSAVVATCIFPLRARRWRTILEPVAGPVAFGPLWRSTAIGMMLNNVFWRAGEFGRAYALNREVPRVPVSTALGSLAVDRIADGVVLLALMFGAMLDPAFPPSVTLMGRTVPQLAAGGAVLAVGLTVLSYLLVLHPVRATAMVRSGARRFVPRFAERIVEVFSAGMGGLAVLRDTSRLAQVMLWALLHWLVQALSFYVALVAVGIIVPFSATLFLMGILGIGSSIPSAPGFFGLFEAIATIGLGVYGVPTELAASWAIGYHIVSFIPITVFGALYFTRLGLSMGAIVGAKSQPRD